MAALAELGLDQNTVVIFTSDHGALRGAHGLTGKWIMYEESIRIPLIVHDPRLPQSLRGTRREQMVLNIDMAPTLLEMAGLDVVVINEPAAKTAGNRQLFDSMSVHWQRCQKARGSDARGKNDDG